MYISSFFPCHSETSWLAAVSLHPPYPLPLLLVLLILTMPAHFVTSVDVAIVGAGLSGLSAAHTFQLYNLNASQPISYVVLEGNDRVGGKTHAVPALSGAPRSMIDSVGGVIDEGATFINDKYHTHMAQLAHKYDFDIEVQYSKGDMIIQDSEHIFKGPVDTFGVRLVFKTENCELISDIVHRSHPDREPIGVRYVHRQAGGDRQYSQ